MRRARGAGGLTTSTALINGEAPAASAGVPKISVSLLAITCRLPDTLVAPLGKGKVGVSSVLSKAMLETKSDDGVG